MAVLLDGCGCVTRGGGRVTQYQGHRIHSFGITSSGSPSLPSSALDLSGRTGASFFAGPDFSGSAGASFFAGPDFFVTQNVPAGRPNTAQALSLLVTPYTSPQSFQPDTLSFSAMVS